MPFGRSLRALGISAAILTGTTSCHDPWALTAVEVRVHNATSLEIEDLLVSQPLETLRHDRLAPGAYTNYESLREGDAAPYIEATIGGRRLVYGDQHLGGQRLERGHYTLRLRLVGTEAEPELSLEVIRDSGPR